MKKKLKRIATSRAVIVWPLIVLQLVLIFVLSVQFTRFFYVFSVVTALLDFIFILYLMKNSRSMSYKLCWIVVAFTFPVFGVALYLIFGGKRASKRSLKKMRFMQEASRAGTAREPCALEELDAEAPGAARQARYIKTTSFCPPVKHCETRYFESGEAMFPVLLEELKKAQRYIFLEYFIIGEGEMWDAVHEILLEKVKAGVDVRVIYDDVGCALAIPGNFHEKLRREGIDCRIFQRFVPFLFARQNNRDHRKICVIDGVTSFTGGINLADEYINTEKRCGYWKDTAVMVRGEASWSFAVMFLTMWDYLCGTKTDEIGDYAEYAPLPGAYEGVDGAGYVQPYTDSPLDGEPVGENVYLGLIENARSYVWITTPYLIVDERMEQALIHAVRSGVDVRIVTPGIPDKILINQTTKSYYPNLLAKGVKIYEYKPGFVHAKGFLVDDEYAVVGSVNLDYRSLYLHFECGLWMYKPDCLPDVKRDFVALIEASESVDAKKPKLLTQLFRAALDLIAPLL
ncbi:MAG: cardiolipin synthase [Clostridiales bacterium]|nr:cardiolipin synthase [Clostridiales bacterium]